MDVESQATIDAAIAQLKAAGDETVDRAIAAFEAAGERLIAKAQDAGVTLFGLPSLSALLTQATAQAGSLISGITVTPGPITVTKQAMK